MFGLEAICLTIWKPDIFLSGFRISSPNYKKTFLLPMRSNTFVLIYNSLTCCLHWISCRGGRPCPPAAPSGWTVGGCRTPAVWGRRPGTGCRPGGTPLQCWPPWLQCQTGDVLSVTGGQCEAGPGRVKVVWRHQAGTLTRNSFITYNYVSLLQLPLSLLSQDRLDNKCLSELAGQSR